MSTEFIPYARQSVDADDVKAAAEALVAEYLTTGPQVEGFEKELASFCGAKYAVACSSGTAALHLACLALSLKQGDAIITSPITFLATANCARFVGADVIFSDVEAATANLSAAALSKTLNDKKRSASVRAVFPVHFAGQPADMENIAREARSHGLKIVEDASHALGAEYRTKSGEWVKVGSCRHSDMTVFSFHPVKHITTGEGGAVTTNDEALYRRLLLLRNHGMVHDSKKGPWFYEMNEVGYNYRITDIQCALGRSQMKKLSAFLKKRREIAAKYQAAFSSQEFPAKPLAVLDDVRHAYHLFVVRVPFKTLGLERADVMAVLKQKGIGTQVHYIPVSLQPYYREHSGTKPGDFPVAEEYYAEALSLPLYPAMPDDGVERVTRALEAVLSSRV